ncbi:MAG TPA: glycoside hydrolase family 78 protein [Anaerolineaceae bacterium]
MTTISQLTCEYRINPLGIDVLQPRLSWQMQCNRRGAYQKSYQVLVAPTQHDLQAGTNILWDSGQTASDQSIHIPYAGPALKSGQRVYWKVRVWDERDHAMESDPAWWEMGLLEAKDWKGRWIGAPFWGGPRTSSPAPYLRREFSLQKPLMIARLYATALGLYECYLNGFRVGDDLLTPGWTDYTKRIQYQVYDVTTLLLPGANVFGAILGDGWAVGNIAWFGRQNYADRPQFLAQIVLTYSDGSRETIATDEQWKVSQGPILEADLLMGESYDARRELSGWLTPGYPDSKWWSVEVFPVQNVVIAATNGPVVKRQEEIKPVAIHKISALQPRWIFDLGQNMVGWIRLTVCGKKETTVTIRHAEVLNPDGTVNTANLRTARSTDYYTLRGGGLETWEPRFTFHGFRYVELQGYPGEPTIDAVTGIVIHSDMQPTGKFSCSDPLINQLQHNILWSQKGNFIDIPTDCPQRDERLGWTGDAQVFARTAAFNFQVAGFFSKWLRDLEDAQSADGAIPNVVPGLLDWSIGIDGGPGWADAVVICPWIIYQWYGDVRIVEDHYASMRRFIHFLDETSHEGLRCYADFTGEHGHGDWLALDGSDGREGGTSKELIGTAFFAYSVQLMIKIAEVLGKKEDARSYARLAGKVCAAFQKRFVRLDGTIEGGTQTAYVLTLAFDLLPSNLRARAAAELVQKIREQGDHLSTGFIGTPYLNWVLSKAGYLDMAYRLLKQTTYPSWLYPVLQGATTIWERWDGWTQEKGFQDPKMNSFNHYAFGAIGAWMVKVIGGIDVDPDRPGYKQVILHPQPGGGLSFAAAELQSLYGMIRSAWMLENNRFEWQVIIPANTTAIVILPARDLSLVKESGKPLQEVDGILFLEVDDQSVVLRVGSGEYHFSSLLKLN